MATRAMSTASISFGLVTVPVRVYPATRRSAGLSFHLLHGRDGARLKQQYVCAEDGEVVPRSEMVKGFEISKGRYVTFTNEELKALDEKATQGIEIQEFVPAETVDPVYFETTYFLGPDKGGEKPYALLAAAMRATGLSAVARYAARGKDYLVLLRPMGDRLAMQQLYHADEVRDVDEVPAAERTVREAELKLARQLVEQIAARKFDPAKYRDEVRARIEDLIERKAGGEDITAPAPERARGPKVVDLMEALKASLARKGSARGRGAPRARAVARRSKPVTARKKESA
jgi:DNA end-binding protein Ku